MNRLPGALGAMSQQNAARQHGMPQQAVQRQLPGALGALGGGMVHPAETTRDAEGMPNPMDAQSNEQSFVDQKLLEKVKQLPVEMTKYVLDLATRGGYQSHGFVNFGELQDVLDAAAGVAATDQELETVDHFARSFGIDLFPANASSKHSDPIR